MSFTHSSGFSAKSDGYAVGGVGDEQLVINPDGEIRPYLKHAVYAANGSIPINTGLAVLDATNNLTLTLADPGKAGILLAITTGTVGSSKTAVVTCATTGALDGTNKKATFAAVGNTLLLLSISATRWVILSNVGEVVLAA